MTGTPIPDALLGIWQRVSVSVRGHPTLDETPAETCDVCWFQGRTRYADLRVPRSSGSGGPLSGAEAFGGRQHWAPPRLRFHHDLDFSGSLAEDEGDLAWDGATLVETGPILLDGVRCEYTERWVRASPVGALIGVRERHTAAGIVDGLAIRIGDEELRLTAAPTPSGPGRVAAERVRLGPDGSRRIIRGLGDGPAPLAGPWRDLERPD